MKSTSGFFAVLISLVLLLMVNGSGIAQAQSTYEIRYVGGADPNNDCGANIPPNVGSPWMFIEVEITINATVAYSYYVEILDGGNQRMGSQGVGEMVFIVDPNNPGVSYGHPEQITVGTYSVSFVTGQVYQIEGFYDPVTRPWRINLIQRETHAVVSELTFDPADYFPACANLPDTRPQPVTFGGDTSTNDAQIFIASDPEGNPALHIYDTESGQGTLELIITKDDIAPYLDNYPHQNTPIMSNGQSSSQPITLYALSTGEFQIHVGPDEDGNVEVMIFDDIPPTMMYGYTFNIYDPPETWAPPWENGSVPFPAHNP